MRPILIPFAERAARIALRRRGVESRFVDTPLGKIHAYDARGEGTLPPVVLLHGIASAATPFAPVLMRLRRHVQRVVAIDYPGHGFSEAPRGRFTPDRLFDVVDHALEALLPEPAILVGNSLGGAVALQRAVRHPTRVCSLVLLSPAGAQSTDEEWDGIRRTFAVTTRAEGRAFLGRLYHRVPLLAHAVAHEMAGSLGRRAIRELIASATNDHTPSPEAIRALTMPVLFFWGRSERLLPDRHYDYFREHLPPHAIVERPDGFGHCPHFDDPGRVARTIVEFARKCTAQDRQRAAMPSAI
jgi:pimeloyl-ACP methyl ester carboxylesterase